MVVKDNCTVGYRMAMKYMRVAKLALRGNFDPNNGDQRFPR